MLTDTGPLVALVDKRDAHYKDGSDFFKRLRVPMVTTWPCLTEAVYLLRSVGGWPYVLDLWGLYEKGFLRLHRARRNGVAARPGSNDNVSGHSLRLCGRFACSGGGNAWNAGSLYAGFSFLRLSHGGRFGFRCEAVTQRAARISRTEGSFCWHEPSD